MLWLWLEAAATVLLGATVLVGAAEVLKGAVGAEGALYITVDWLEFELAV